MPVTSFRAPNRTALAGCPALVNEVSEPAGERLDLEVIAVRGDGLASR